MQRIQQAVGILFRPVLFLLYFLSGLPSRDPRRWVFGSWGGMRFCDNGAALFRYCASLPGSPVRVTWITMRPAIVRDLRARGLRAHHAWSPAGLLACLRAGVFVFDGYTKDVNHWLSRGARRVLLRHGVGIKKIERAIDTPSHRLYRLFHGNPLQRLGWRLLVPWHDTPLHLILSTSEEHARQGQRFFGVERERIAITGFARNDVLFDEDWERHADAETLAWIRAAKAEGHAVFLYMPTFRDDRRSPFPFRWEELDEGLGARRIQVLARLHLVDENRVDDPRAAERRARSRNVRFDEPQNDPYPLFHAVDGLITDFSSVAYDFMLTRKPVVFFHPDLEAYEASSRSLDFDYDAVTPGPRPRTLHELFEALEGARAGPLHAGYEALLQRFHQYRDGGSAERSYRTILVRAADGAPARRRAGSGRLASEARP